MMTPDKLMAKTQKKIPPVARLEYSKGDLIVKAGDYGISTYEIISGKVEIFVESEGMKTRLSVLEPGMIFGKKTFIMGNTDPRSASGRALEDCCLEAWHPAMLLNDYNQMSAVVKRIADQVFRFMVRMDKITSGLSMPKDNTKKRQVKEPFDPSADRRKYYRKKVGIECFFRPANGPEDTQLMGRVRDISKGGLQMVVGKTMSQKHAFIVGEELMITMDLLPHQQVSMTAKTLWLKKEEKTGSIRIGTVYTHINPETQQKLGFFLMK